MNTSTILSGLSCERRPVWQVCLSFSSSLVLIVSTLFGPPALAGQAVLLNDDELDSVFAEGFSISFDVSMTRPKIKDFAKNTHNNNSPKGSQIPKLNNPPAPPSKPISNNSSANNANVNSEGAPGLLPVGSSGLNAVFVNDKSQQFLSSFVNINAAGSVVPVMLNLMINVKSTITEATNTNNLDLTNFYDIKLPAQALSPVEAPSAPTIDPGPVQNEPPISPPANNPIDTHPIDTPLDLPLNTSDSSHSSSEPPASQAPADILNNPLFSMVQDPGASNSGSEPLLNSPLLSLAPTARNPASISAASGTPVETPVVIESSPIQSSPGPSADNQAEPVNSLESPAETSSPVSMPAHFPEISSLPESPVDMNLLQDNAPSNLEVEAPNVEVETPSFDIQSISPTGSGFNVVMIGAQAQQNLSSFVNVNSAGSIVPVLINFVININSNVNNLSNSNRLSFEDHYRYYIN